MQAIQKLAELDVKSKRFLVKKREEKEKKKEEETAQGMEWGRRTWNAQPIDTKIIKTRTGLVYKRVKKLNGKKKRAESDGVEKVEGKSEKAVKVDAAENEMLKDKGIQQKEMAVNTCDENRKEIGKDVKLKKLITKYLVEKLKNRRDVAVGSFEVFSSDLRDEEHSNVVGKQSDKERLPATKQSSEKSVAMNSRKSESSLHAIESVKSVKVVNDSTNHSTNQSDIFHSSLKSTDDPPYNCPLNEQELDAFLDSFLTKLIKHCL